MQHATEIKRNYITRHCVFAIDGEEYLDMLPTSTDVGSGDLIKSTTCCAGSRAISVDGKQFILNGEDKWVKYTGGSGGGGGGGDDPSGAEDITDEDIEHLFD